MAKKFYGVRAGRETGVFDDWDACRASVEGYTGAKYKGFLTRQDAQDYVDGKDPDTRAVPNVVLPDGPYGFTDGSYDPVSDVAGYGGFLVTPDGRRHVVQGHTEDPDETALRNVAGEVHGAMALVTEAVVRGLKTLTVFYDYEGVAKWARGEWRANTALTRQYAAFVEWARHHLTLDFIHVKGHSGVPGNEEADRLARQAVGL